jgi:hypothetical protein
MSRPGRPGHDFHFPGGSECPVRKWGKNPNDFNGAFLPGQRALSACVREQSLIISIVSVIAFTGQIINCAPERRDPWP